MNTFVLYQIYISTIFIGVAIQFLFPSNEFFPFDRRITGLFGSAFCVLFHWLFLPEKSFFNPGDLVDTGVLLILFSIMMINYVLLHQTSVKNFIKDMQQKISTNLDHAFWIVSFIAFVSSPFITNDGLCLILVDPVLDAFISSEYSHSVHRDTFVSSIRKWLDFLQLKLFPNHIPTWSAYWCGSLESFTSSSSSSSSPSPVVNIADDLKRTDAKSNRFFFMLAIACSANIGSAATFTGNPQNIIISGFLSPYMSGGTFFGLLFLPAVTSWLVTTYYINYCRRKATMSPMDRNLSSNISNMGIELGATYSPFSDVLEENTPADALSSRSIRRYSFVESAPPSIIEVEENISSSLANTNVVIRDSGVPCSDANLRHPLDQKKSGSGSGSGSDSSSHMNTDNVELSLLDNLAHEPSEPSESFLEELKTSVATSSILVFSLFLVLVVLEFWGVLPLTIIFPMTAILLVVFVLLTNYYLGYPRYYELPGSATVTGSSMRRLITIEQRLIWITEYVERMFHSLDYNLLIIFVGLFIVSGSFVRTGIPAAIWTVVAGSSPLRSPTSVILISIYTIICSQLVGNVALVVMTSPDISQLDINHQRFGWCLLAWVSTVAGNFTLTGSAANIIVAEKASRHGLYSHSKQNPPNNVDTNNKSNSSQKNSDQNFSPELQVDLSIKCSDNSIEKDSSPSPSPSPSPSSSSSSSARVHISSVEHFKICGILTLLCIGWGTIIIVIECVWMGYL